MTGQASAPYQSRSRQDRAQAVVATLLVHAALLAALLMSHDELAPLAADRSLALFDVAPLPPPPPPEPAPRPPRHVRPDHVRPTSAGGAPRGSPAPPASVVTPRAIIEAPDVTLVPESIALPLPDSGAIADSGSGTANAAGLGGVGQGAGIGRGDDDGNETGGRRDRYRAAAWIYRPTNSEMSAYWPATARQNRISGKAVLSCTLLRSGRPKRCVTLNEFPEGAGFGDAAIRLSPTFRIRHVLRNNQPLDVPVIVPIAFDYRRL